MHYFVTRTCFLLLASTIATAQVNAIDPGVARLHTLYNTTRERFLREDPRLASAEGDKRYNALWPNLSLASLQGIAKENQAASTNYRKSPPKPCPSKKNSIENFFDAGCRTRSTASGWATANVRSIN